MKNWAGNIQFQPKNILAPHTTQEVQSMVKEHLKNKSTIRMRGSAHSWTDLISTNDSYLHLDHMQGLVHVDPEKKVLNAKAGTKLYLLGEEAFKHQLALPNQGDINQQSVAGALSSGTHGTGVTLQSMSNQIESLTMVTGTGEILSVSRDSTPEMLKAIAVSFGSLGLITELSLKMIDAYKLKVETFPENMDTALEHSCNRLKQNRHLEMFYFPVGDWSIVKLMNMTQENVTPKNIWHTLNDVVLENWLYEKLNQLANTTQKYSSIDKIMRKFVGHNVKVDWSHRAFPTQRSIRFMEMEYNLPIEKFQEVFAQIKASIKKNKFHTLFPIEIRFVKNDDLWLSPASGRDSVYFAIHTYITEEWRPYFNAMEEIFKKHGGRPHWGKWHSLKDDTFQGLYPKWHEFKKLRCDLDPQGIWLNQHLKDLFAL